MSAVAELDALSAWFGQVGAASMELPNGWFGRPMDNLHRLTWSTVRDDRMFLELDGQVHLILAGCESTQESSTFTLRCEHVVLSRRAFGSSEELESRVFAEGGLVRFHAHAADR